MTTDTLAKAKPAPRLTVEAVSYSILGACAATGIGRSRMFELLKEGKIKAKRMGSHRLIPREELDRFIASLPPG